MDIKSIITDLKKVMGLGNINLLNKKDLDYIRNNEEKNNIGVFECLKREYVLIAAHDSSFRNPEGDIVKKEKEEVIFPAVRFSEVKAKNVVSSSPSIKIHNYLIERFKLRLDDEATLIIGFDLK